MRIPDWTPEAHPQPAALVDGIMARRGGKLINLDKGAFLREFEPDFFFDDQTGHIESAAQHVPAGHVVSGVKNPAP